MIEIGARVTENGMWRFCVWAPLHNRVTLHIVDPYQQHIDLEKDEAGYWRSALLELPRGARYLLSNAGGPCRPDPASHSQPEGVHAASEVVDHRLFNWTDAQWKGIALERMVMYELHVGTFTPHGNLSAVEKRLDDLAELGVNTIELMPVAQFPGSRNWGYDGVYPFAVHNTYGGPHALKSLVDCCHRKGIAVILDVVYNHFGPEGNYTAEFAPYCTDRHSTPWGSAVNFDDEYNQGVRNYVIQNALHWITHYHIDALRLDAIHGIFDESRTHILAELATRVKERAGACGRRVYLIAESDLNESRVIRSHEEGGWGLDAQWCDDFHHALHAALTHETHGYYADFGTVECLRKSLRQRYVYSGEFSRFRQRTHGDCAGDLPAGKFIVCAQNHDQVGNRAAGERLSSLAGFQAAKLAAMAVLFSGYIPLLFMGEEYAEDAPFLYFVSHSDPALIKAVREGRCKEFSCARRQSAAADPQDEDTFSRSRLQWEKRGQSHHKIMLAFYKELLRLRNDIPVLGVIEKAQVRVEGQGGIVQILRAHPEKGQVCIMLNCSSGKESADFKAHGAEWRTLIDSAHAQWSGDGSLLAETLEKDTRVELVPWQAAAYCAKDHR